MPQMPKRHPARELWRKRQTNKITEIEVMLFADEKNLEQVDVIHNLYGFAQKRFAQKKAR
ncbi:MAG: hypothetical protein COV47_02100 [Candidatus Diapherotrites archaeon CG11_big_fil_rev_8_21_14_0_20_37_9]|nr:MAG: hypothetical protein COV47_02100 [Candidatus Diapherotrites archaeon CG11_big_fil_rev_8_21_14_0_20_37_9]